MLTKLRRRVARWKDLAHEANAARVALDGRVRELVAQLEARAAADTTLITFNDSLKAAEARVQELESTNAALRNELSRDMQASAESECAALRAEVERLRNHIVCINDERSAAEGGEHLQRAAAEVAESRLAAANALLGRFKARYNALPAIPHAGQWKACAVDTMADIEGWPKDDDARLAAVPATAPTRDEGEAE